jgi:SAM-dependent methyltransferase
MTITDEQLAAIDLLAFNDGENPYKSDSVLNGFAEGAAFYRGEVERFGFSGHDRVLDLMCGFGRWSVFLAEANRAVVGLDRNPGTIRIARGLAPALGLTNATFDAGDVTETARFDDASFDAVWIWNALIYVERGPCLSEIARLLRPGGRVLVGSMNSTGRLVQKLLYGCTGIGKRRRAHRRQALTALRRGPRFDGRPNYATPATTAEVFGAHGLDVIEVERIRARVLGVFPKTIHVLAERSSAPARVGATARSGENDPVPSEGQPVGAARGTVRGDVSE